MDDAEAEQAAAAGVDSVELKQRPTRSLAFPPVVLPNTPYPRRRA